MPRSRANKDILVQGILDTMSLIFSRKTPKRRVASRARSFFIYRKSDDRLIWVSPTLLPHPVGLLLGFLHRPSLPPPVRRSGGSASAGCGGPNNFLTRGFPREFPVRFRAESPRHLHSLRVVCRAVYLLVISYAVLLGRSFPPVAVLRSPLAISSFLLLFLPLLRSLLRSRSNCASNYTRTSAIPSD